MKGLCFLALVIGLTNLVGAYEPSLKHYNVDPASITVSVYSLRLEADNYNGYGISSGAAMATQFHFAHSTEIKGAGMFAGGPYMCAYGGFAAMAAECMMTPSIVILDRLITETAILSSSKLIDDTSNIANSNVYIWHGTKDSVVHQGAGKKMHDMYAHYSANIKTEFTYEAEHGQPTYGFSPTHNYGGPCGVLNVVGNFINNCGYMGAFEMLNHLYDGNLIRPNDTDFTTGELLRYNQADFFLFAPELVSMARGGDIYVPRNCQNGATTCRLHVAFHGCMSNNQFVGDKYATKSGYIEAADVNDIIILFPQIHVIGLNPSGCWDWFGYLGGLEYPTKRGDQITAVYKMIKRIVEG